MKNKQKAIDLNALKKIYKNHKPEVDNLALNSNLRVQRKWYEEKMDNILPAIKNKKRSLDMGCGSGSMTLMINKRNKNVKI